MIQDHINRIWMKGIKKGKQLEKIVLTPAQYAEYYASLRPLQISDPLTYCGTIIAVK